MLIAAQSNEYPVKDQDRVLLDTVGAYRKTMTEFAAMKNLEVWYARLEIEKVLEEYGSQLQPKTVKRTEKALAKAQTKDSMAAFSKLTHIVDGEARIAAEPPLIVPAADLVDGHEREELFDGLHELLRTYRASLEHDRRVLLEEFRHRGLRAQGRGRRQRRHARLDRAAARARRRRPAVPADEGGPALGARGVPRARASSPTAASASSRASG